MIVPDLIEPIVGWRVWIAERDARGLALHSLYYAMEWPGDRATEARCRGGAGPCRDDDHLCGVHAVRSLELAARYLPERLQSLGGWLNRSTQVVVGTAVLWGDVAEHADGWRAQYAYPQSIYVPSIFKARRVDCYASEAYDLLARRYAGVDVHVFRRLDDLRPAVAA